VPRATTSATARRILVYGVTGSGKSTAARRIAARTGLPLTIADDLTWEPGWEPVPEDEQRRRFAAIVEKECWLLDTAYTIWLDLVLPRADLIVGLDYPRWLSLQRLVWRSVVRAIDKRPICNGNTESFRSLFSKDSILLWHFRTFRRKQATMRAWALGADNAPPILLFSRPRDLQAWIDGLEPAGPDASAGEG
jgi:adenylate kinase family enzyme